MRALLTVAVLLGLLGATVGVAFWAWQEMGEVEIGRHGLIALGLGALVTFALGAGLMALVFFSNRHGYDDQAYRQDDLPDRPGRADEPRPPGPPDRR
jgi:hypothetical protein